MNWLFLLSFILSIHVITPYLLEEVQKYFESETVTGLNNLWRKHRIAYQNALCFAMQEGYGTKGMNVYIKRPTNPYLVSKSYYHTDNQVHIILQELNLDELPRISDPLISLPLPSNTLKLEATVSKMIIHANYVLFRNTSNIVYNLKGQNPYKISPFLFEQVKNMGQLAMTIEGCKLSGMGVTSLTAYTVTLGYSVFRLHQCQFNLEIFTRGIASPPVIANYLPKNEGLDMEHLIMKRLSAELIPKLQAALFTYVNTSAVFEDNIYEIRYDQRKMFEETAHYVINVIRNVNKLTMKRNLSQISLDDFCIRWSDTTKEGAVESVIKLQDMVLLGLENLYSSQTGGPIKLASVKISEEIIFNYLQVRGNFVHQVGDNDKAVYDFAVHIDDVQVDLVINVDLIKNQAGIKNEGHQSEAYKIHIMGWRSAQFSSTGMKYSPGEALITGYLLNKLPEYLTNHLSGIINDAVLETELEYKEIDNSGPGENVIKPEELSQTDLDQSDPVEYKEPDNSGVVENAIDPDEFSQTELEESESVENKEIENSIPGENVLDPEELTQTELDQSDPLEHKETENSGAVKENITSEEPIQSELDTNSAVGEMLEPEDHLDDQSGNEHGSNKKRGPFKQFAGLRF